MFGPTENNNNRKPLPASANRRKEFAAPAADGLIDPIVGLSTTGSVFLSGPKAHKSPPLHPHQHQLAHQPPPSLVAPCVSIISSEFPLNSEGHFSEGSGLRPRLEAPVPAVESADRVLFAKTPIYNTNYPHLSTSSSSNQQYSPVYSPVQEVSYPFLDELISQVRQEINDKCCQSPKVKPYSPFYGVTEDVASASSACSSSLAGSLPSSPFSSTATVSPQYYNEVTSSTSPHQQHHDVARKYSNASSYSQQQSPSFLPLPLKAGSCITIKGEDGREYKVVVQSAESDEPVKNTLKRKSSAPVDESEDAKRKRAPGISLANLSDEEIAERKKQQNREAAQRYRQKLKTCKASEQEERCQLSDRNNYLRKRSVELEKEIADIRQLIFGAPRA